MFGIEEYHEERIETFKFIFQRAIENTITVLSNPVITFEYNPETRMFKYLETIKMNETILLSAISRNKHELKDYLDYKLY